MSTVKHFWKLPMSTNASIRVFLCFFGFVSTVAYANDADKDLKQRATATQAKALLDRAKNKLRSIKSLTVDFDLNHDPKQYYKRMGEVSMERPNRYRLDVFDGLMGARRVTQF